MQIKIGSKRYKIIYVNNISNVYDYAKMEDGKEVKGLCIHDKKKILIKKEPDQEGTLFHELSHAIIGELQEKVSKHNEKLNILRKDEVFIQKLSEILREMFNLK